MARLKPLRIQLLAVPLGTAIALICAPAPLLSVPGLSAWAQDAAPPAEAAGRALEERRRKAVAEIEAISRSIAVSEDTRRSLEAEMAAIAENEAAISAALIQSAKTERKLADDIAALSDELVRLDAERSVIAASLRERSAILAEVLAALQRMGRNPPPAMLVTPQDALSSVRSAVLLGAVVPSMRAETLALRDDLTRMAALAERTARARAGLETGMRAQAGERSRLDLLLDRQKALSRQSREALDAEAQRMEEMAASVKNLQALLTGIDKSMADVRASAEARRAAIEKARLPGASQPSLGPAVSFASLRGTLPVPVSGARVLSFGARNDAGVASGGDTFRTRSGAIVIAPADAVVAFAAPFRSYGHIVILDTGDGYRMVIAGLAKLGVRAGQTVLAGEPLGAMGQSGAAGVAVSAATVTEPELYVELRKDGQAIDPASWWQASTAGLQGDDT
jgi:septal ring factor EnvC (AmiA/AmiB activator)